jgi:hypothetical protein
MHEHVIEKSLETMAHGAILAFSIRLARRVLPMTSVLSKEDHEVVDNSIRHAEVMLAGVIPKPKGVDNIFRAYNLSKQANEAGRIALANAIDAAVSTGFLAEVAVASSRAQMAHHASITYLYANRAIIAARISDRLFDSAADRDLDLLREMHIKEREGLDPSETGPLGPFWPSGPPDWKALEYQLLNPDRYEYAPLSVHISPGNASPALIEEFYGALDNLYRTLGGSGLRKVGS